MRWLALLFILVCALLGTHWIYVVNHSLHGPKDMNLRGCMVTLFFVFVTLVVIGRQSTRVDSCDRW